jgi:hypothetical protein
MAKCLMRCYVISDLRSHGTGHAVCQCTTHSWDFGQVPVTATTQCPIGRIEEKLEEAVARIEQCVKDLETSRGTL